VIRVDHLFLGGEVNLVGIIRLALDSRVLLGGVVAVALASRAGTARAASASDGVLISSLAAVAGKSGLLAARASGLLG
jgi:hypothetical protein